MGVRSSIPVEPFRLGGAVDADLKTGSDSKAQAGDIGWFDHVPVDQWGRRDVIEARGCAACRRPSEVHEKLVAELRCGAGGTSRRRGL